MSTYNVTFNNISYRTHNSFSKIIIAGLIELTNCKDLFKTNHRVS